MDVTLVLAGHVRQIRSFGVAPKTKWPEASAAARPHVQPRPSAGPDQAVEDLRAAGAEVAGPDEASLATFGKNPLDPSTRQPAAQAGRAQGRALKLEWSPS